MAAEPSGRQPSQLVNQGVGLLVFLGGVILLAVVFAFAYRMYSSLDATVLQVQTVRVAPAVPQLPPAKAAPAPGQSLTASPQDRPNLTALAVVLVLKLVVLLVMAWIGGLIASKGIGLAVGPRRVVEHPPS